LVSSCSWCGGLAWLGLASSQDSQPTKGATEFYFHHDHIIGTSLDLWITTTDEAAAESAEQAILDEIERLRRIFSLYDPTANCAGSTARASRWPCPAR